MKRLLHIVLISASLLYACDEKEEEIPPSIETTAFELVNLSTAKVTGVIDEPGNSAVSDYGFVYSSYSYPTIEAGTKISLGKSPAKGAVTADIPLSDNQVNIRMYLTNSVGTAYGKLLSITTPTPHVSQISPTLGKIGDQIQIFGASFSPVVSDNKVRFGSTAAQIIKVEEDILTVAVPDCSTSIDRWDGRVDINVSIGSKEYTLYDAFTLLPTVTGYSPKNGGVGTKITITGNGFTDNYYYNNYIYFGNDISSYYTYVNSNTVTVEVPTGIKTSPVMMSLKVGGANQEIGLFTFDPPVIESVSPTSGFAGLTEITIKGKHFKKIKIGDVEIDVFRIYGPNEIIGLLPNSLVVGTYEVQAYNGIEWVTATEKIEVIKPVVTDITPSSGYAGSKITFTGNFFNILDGSNWATVTFGDYGESIEDIAIDYTTASPLQKITVKTSDYIEVGTYDVFFYIDPYYSYSSYVGIPTSYKYTVKPSIITSFSPTSGYPGDQITIKGEGLKNSEILFGTTNAYIVSTSTTEIKVLVPTMGAGNMKISAVKNGNTITSNTNFTVK